MAYVQSQIAFSIHSNKEKVSTFDYITNTNFAQKVFSTTSGYGFSFSLFHKLYLIPYDFSLRALSFFARRVIIGLICLGVNNTVTCKKVMLALMLLLNSGGGEMFRT